VEELSNDIIIDLVRRSFAQRVLSGRVRTPGPVIAYDEVDSVENITPRVAMELIAACWERYENGRNFYPTKLYKIVGYADAMAQGNWQWREDSDPICITDGLVTGGRHRLHAVLLSSTTQRFNVKRKTTKEPSNG
jgi:hypothetical protein